MGGDSLGIKKKRRRIEDDLMGICLVFLHHRSIMSKVTPSSILLLFFLIPKLSPTPTSTWLPRRTQTSASSASIAISSHPPPLDLGLSSSHRETNCLAESTSGFSNTHFLHAVWTQPPAAARLCPHCVEEVGVG